MWPKETRSASLLASSYRYFLVYPISPMKPDTHIQKEAQDFRLFLQNELVRRCKANPRYSLRAFAKSLRMESSALSKILSGRRSVSPSMLLKLSQNLGLSPLEVAPFKSQIVEKRGKKKQEVVQHEFQQLTLDHFQVIADWYHFAILELTTTQHFQGDNRWIARKLGVSVMEVNAAVERLQRLGYLEIGPKGEWIDRSGDLTTVGNEFTAIAFRKLQAQILQGALKAMEEVPLELRDQSAMTMAIDSRLLPEAKKKIKRFRRELCSLLQKSKYRDEVYQLGVSFYPVTNKEV